MCEGIGKEHKLLDSHMRNANLAQIAFIECEHLPCRNRTPK